MTLLDWKTFRELIYQKRVGQTPGQATTYKQIEAELGLPRRSIERVVNGRTPNVTTYLRLCQWLGLPLDYALTDCNKFVTFQEAGCANLN